MIGNSFYVFDCKSKFGTLVRSETMSLELGRSSRGIQIGRTMLVVEIKRDNYKENSRNELLLKNK
jgi:hypothetical protein